MGKRFENAELDSLFDGILTLKDREECYKFFGDVCTIKELQDMSQRLAVAKMLRQNCKYQQIAEKTGASTATISRISRTLNYGNDGYDMVLDRIQQE